MTEQEASVMVCPFMVIGTVVSKSGYSMTPSGFNCISSQCMMWVWHGSPISEDAKSGCCGLIAPRC